MDDKNITITLKEYIQLKKNTQIFNVLEWVGVDNWEGWDVAMKLLKEQDKEWWETNNDGK